MAIQKAADVLERLALKATATVEAFGAEARSGSPASLGVAMTPDGVEVSHDEDFVTAIEFGFATIVFKGRPVEETGLRPLTRA